MVKILDFQIFHKAQQKAQSRAGELMQFLLKKRKENGICDNGPLSKSFEKEVQKIYYESERYIQEQEAKDSPDKDNKS